MGRSSKYSAEFGEQAVELVNPGSAVDGHMRPSGKVKVQVNAL